MNSLGQDQYKYNPIRELRFTSAQPIATTTVTTTTATASTEAAQKSLLQNFLEEMLKSDDVSIPTRVTVFTTEQPDWTISTPLTTPYAIGDDSEITTMAENSPSDTTLANSEEKHTTYESSAGSSDESITERQATSFEQASSRQEIRQEIKSTDGYWSENSQEDKSERNNVENSVARFNQEYKLSSNYGSKTTKEVEDTVAKLTGFPTAAEDIHKLSAIENGNKEKEHIMTLRRQKEENAEENEAHPKNHRAKWSEVRYPSALDKSQSALKLRSTTSIPGIVTRNEGDTSVKTLSDYVKAIFDSMKNAEREEEEEIAKVVEAVNETPVDDSRFSNVASVRKISGKKAEGSDHEVGTTDSSQEAFTTRQTRIEEIATNAEEAQTVTESTTTNESTTGFETITLMPDTTTNTMATSEETMITESSTSTLAKKTTSSIKQTNVLRANSTDAMLGKILRTSTTTKVSHMTEICYRGRCVMTKPNMEDVKRR